MTISKWDIDSLSGVWILAGTFIVYCVACLAIGVAPRLYHKYMFRKAREARAKYQLQIRKDKESENHN